MVNVDAAGVAFLHVCYIIADMQHHLVSNQSFFHEVEDEEIGHFPYDKPPLFMGVGLLQHLSRAEAAR